MAPRPRSTNWSRSLLLLYLR